jgi:hypothetical protein
MTRQIKLYFILRGIGLRPALAWAMSIQVRPT